MITSQTLLCLCLTARHVLGQPVMMEGPAQFSAQTRAINDMSAFESPALQEHVLGQPVMMEGPSPLSAQARAFSDLSVFEAPALQVDRSLQMRAKASIDRAVSTIEQTLNVQEQANRAAFDAGIDLSLSKSVTQTDMGPHLLTTQAALDMERAGQAFIGVSRQVADSAITDTVGSQRAVQFDRLDLRPISKKIQCPFDTTNLDCNQADKYRSIDGSCNNVDNPIWGKASTPFERFIHPWYDDGVSSARNVSFHNGELPNARLISRQFHLPLSYPSKLSHLAMEYGQFLSHDIQFNALSRGYRGSSLDCCRQPNRFNCLPIYIPSGDTFFRTRTCLNFVRSVSVPNLNCNLGARQQLNQNTHFHDASQVYGSDTDTARSLRTMTGGLLKTSSNNLLPKDTNNGAACILSSQAKPCFRAGDVRANQQPALISLQTIWMREHNRLANDLSRRHVTWDDEKLYQEARRIVIALMQHITYSEYLPLILGDAAMNTYGLNPRSSGYFYGYQKTEKPMIRNGFSTAAFRFGHSMISDHIPTHNGFSVTTNKYLKDVFIRPDLVYDRGVDEITRGLTRSQSEETDRHVTRQVTRHLFERQPGQGSDLIATNIQRGRDHGLPNYQLWRRHCGLSGQYSHDRNIRDALRNVYAHPNDMDLFTAGVSEIPVFGGQVGPTFACLIGQQFRSLKTGDRFYYENNGPTGFTEDQLDQIRKMTLAKIICRNTGISRIQRRALEDVQSGNQLVNCNYIPDIDLTPWSSGGGCVPVHGGWSSWQKTPCFGMWRIKYRTCTNPAPNVCGRSCSSAPYEIQIEFCRFTLPWDDFRSFDGIRRRQGPVGMDSAAIGPMPDLQQNSALLEQVKSQLNGMVSGSAKNIDASVFERALQAASPAETPALEPIRTPDFGPGRTGRESFNGPIRDMRGPALK